MYDLKTLQKSFNRAALSYDASAQLQRYVGEQLVSRLTYFKLQPQVIVEIGSATGFCTRMLQQIYPAATIIVIDLANRMHHIARLQNQTHSHPEYVCADAAHLPVATHSVDLIFSNLTVQWLDDLYATFNEWQRIIKPSGSMLLSTLAQGTLHELVASWHQVDNYPHVENFKTVQNLGDALQQTGWLDPVVDTEEVILAYEELRDLFKDLKGIGAHLLCSERFKGLMGKKRWQTFCNNYRRDFYVNENYHATYQVMFANAWVGTPRARRENDEYSFPIQLIRKRLNL